MDTMRSGGAVYAGRRDEGAFTVSTTRTGPGIVVVQVHGELDLLTAPILTEELRRQLTAGCRVLIVDLSGVAFLGAHGMTAIVRARDLAANTTDFALAGPTRPIVARALEVGWLTRTLPSYPTLGHAVATLTRPLLGR